MFLDSLLRALAPVFEKLNRESEHQYKRLLRLRALRARQRWRKADAPRLLRLGIGPAAQRRLARLLESEGSRGGPGAVAEPQTLAQKIAAELGFWWRLLGPDTPPHERRRLYKGTRWWPHLVEAAYRGELETAKRAGGDKSAPHLSASAIAEMKVGEAARISAALVHQLCQRARADRGDGPPEYPEMTAAELKQHFEEGPRTRPS